MYYFELISILTDLHSYCKSLYTIVIKITGISIKLTKLKN